MKGDYLDNYRIILLHDFCSDMPEDGLSTGRNL